MFRLWCLALLFSLFTQKYVDGPRANEIYNHQRWDKRAITNVSKPRQRILENYIDNQRCKEFKISRGDTFI